MNRLGIVIVTAVTILAALSPQKSEARVFVGIGIGGCCYGGGYGYPYYYPQPVYAAPPVVYATPVPAAYALSPSVPADQTSPTFVDAFGRTCRQYQATTTGTFGTACLQQDGSWRIVQ